MHCCLSIKSSLGIFWMLQVYTCSKIKLVQLLSSLNPPILPSCCSFLDLETFTIGLSKVTPRSLLLLLNFFVSQIPHLHFESFSMQPSLPSSLPKLQPQSSASLTLSSSLIHGLYIYFCCWHHPGVIAPLWLAPGRVFQ